MELEEDERSDQPEAESLRRGFAPGGGSQLAKDVGDMGVDGTRSDEQRHRYLWISQVLTQERQHLALAAGQCGVR
jgi:hypothetical protein